MAKEWSRSKWILKLKSEWSWKISPTLNTCTSLFEWPAFARSRTLHPSLPKREKSLLKKNPENKWLINYHPKIWSSLRHKTLLLHYKNVYQTAFLDIKHLSTANPTLIGLSDVCRNLWNVSLEYQKIMKYMWSYWSSF